MSPFRADTAGPFQSWPAARRVEQIALDLADREPGDPDYALMLGEWIEQLLDIADQLDEPPPLQVLAAPSRCGLRGSMTGRATTGGREACDRPQGHQGMHSYEAGWWKARAHDAEHQARQVPELQAKVARAWAEASRERDRANAAEEQVGFFTKLNARRKARRAARRG